MRGNEIKKIKIFYYALLREERGLTQEEIEVQEVSLRKLYERLQKEHHFSLDAAMLRVARNHDFVNWDTELEDGDEVIFIPPVAGG